jgi:FkbM family methyltransferase
MYSSQDNQDKFLETNVFKGHKNGIYVDVGAHDGITINNTLYFERYNNWSGINIEPIKTVFEKLEVNRTKPNNINLNVAVCNFDGETDFYRNTGYTEMISGIISTFDNRHLQRLAYENSATDGETIVVKVEVNRLETIFDRYNIKYVNYLSIDVEGGEFEVIKSINFDKVAIDIIGFENNYNDISIPIISYLESRGYIRINPSSGNMMDIFMIYRTSVFFHNVENLCHGL